VFLFLFGSPPFGNRDTLKAMAKEISYINVQTSKFGVPEYEIVFESKYCPKLRTDQMVRLSKLKKETGVPITIMVREALDDYLSKLK
jgi:hypothetical protein